MNKRIITIILAALFIQLSLFAQSVPPKREFRGAWVATVANLDWPSNPNLSTEQQKAQLIKILDDLKALGINAVVFQVRAECDAFYNSPYEPWSYWLTGRQGRAPNPEYDPLTFAVKEAHKRGMELHAWFNPYRAVKTVGSYTIASNHVSVEHPDWILTFGSLKILDPGLPQVRDYVTKVIMDVVRRYDIDGVHFDDYFYPYSGITNQDDATFSKYPRGFSNKEDWRRDNVNIFVKEVYDSIQVAKPYVKFGISPFGIWKYNVPSGIVGLSSYNDLYADCIHWMKTHTVDYITPQLYWPFGGGQDYGKLLPWYASYAKTYNVHFYPGEAAYRINSWSSASEMPRHIRLGRSNPNCQGNIYFRALVGLLDNEKGFTDSLKNDIYRYQALVPQMNWKDSVAPNSPQNLKFDKLPSSGVNALRWDLPQKASDGDTAIRYVVYKFETQNVQPQDIEDASKIYDIVGERFNVPKVSNNASGKAYFGVTAVDRNSNESTLSNIIGVTSPSVPELAGPANYAYNQADTVILKWNFTDKASEYAIEVSIDSTFQKDILVNRTGIADTFAVVTGMTGLRKYYWRVKAANVAGYSDYSKVFSYETGFPVAPILLDPPHATVDVLLDPVLKWATADSATSYELQVSNSYTFNSSTIIIDSTAISDTSLHLKNLTQNQIYFWRVRASNKYGASEWSDAFGFKTESTTDVSELSKVPKNYNLSQNYPNPFNPSTQIKFAIPRSGYTTLKVYNLIGKEVAVLVNENLSPGIYTVNFDGSNLSSGIYFYRLSSGSIMINKKMILLK